MINVHKIEIIQALARGYCHVENSDKVLDNELIDAMAMEVCDLLWEKEVFKCCQELKN